MSVVLSDANTLAVYAEQVLSTAAGALGSDAPELQYVAAGSAPAYDCCPALIVYVDQLAEAQTNPNVPVLAPGRRVPIGAVLLARYQVVILRCAANPGPNGQLPSTDAMMDVAYQTNTDVFALMNGLREAVRDGELFETCTGVLWDGCRPVREQGGCVGWEITLRAMIQGILEP